MYNLNILRLLNYYNLDYPYLDNIETQTNLLVNKTMNNFLNKYSEEIKNNFTFIFQYNNNIYSFLTYRIIKNLSGILQFKLKVYGKPKYFFEKEMFKNIEKIGYRKSKRLKNKVFISDFNPICNVKINKTLSKFFTEIFYPIKYFTPKELEVLQSFYIDKDSDFYYKNIGQENSLMKNYYNAFEDINNENLLLKIFNYCKNIDYNIPVCYYYLNGDSRDFGIYDLIMEHDKENYICVYIILENYNESVQFFKDNLNKFLSGKNRINNYNIINNKENFEKLKQEDKDLNLFLYSDYLKQEENNNESNNC